jgi:hypothetical protein
MDRAKLLEAILLLLEEIYDYEMLLVLNDTPATLLGEDLAEASRLLRRCRRKLAAEDQKHQPPYSNRGAETSAEG